jgi:formate hydrogenlyase transcriptional activator
VDRFVRLGVVAFCAVVVVCTVVVWSDLEAIVGRPAPGFPIFSNGVVSFALFETDPSARLGERLRPFERVVAVDDRPVASGQEIRAYAAGRDEGALVAYTLRRFDGSHHVEHVPVDRPTRGDVWRIYGPFLLLGAAMLAVGALAVLVRPELTTTRLVFAFTAGLGIPMGMLVPDHFESYRLSPWLRGLAFLAPAALLHLGLVFPRRTTPVVRAPSVVLAAVYGGSMLLLALHLLGFFHDARLLAITAWMLVAWLVTAFGLLTGNLAWSARWAPSALERQQARVVLPGPLAMALGLALFSAASALSIQVYPAIQFLPALILIACLTYAMLGHNLFEFDAAVRRTVTLALLGLIGAATYLGVFTVARWWLGLGLAWASTVATSVLVLLAAPAFGVVRSRVDRLVEGLLFPAQRASRELLRDVAREIGRLRGPDELLAFLRDAFDESLGCTDLRIVGGRPDAVLDEIAPRDARRPHRLPPADPLYVAIRRGIAVSATATAPRHRGGPSRAAVRRATELGAALVVPLPPSRHGIGGLLLGDRRDGRLYTHDDERLVATLAGPAAIALENAQAVQALRTLERRASAENVQLREEARLDPARGDLVGRSPAMRELMAQLHQVAPSDAYVLVQGETGTGKELVVRAIHSLSPRSSRALVQVACAALPESLLESELFGHEKGAFTGADDRKLGRLEIAHGGTLFLDDVDTLPLAVQAKLLRALQDGELQRLGAARVIRVDLRVIAATNRDLAAEVRAGQFREDLYYRLCVVPIQVPPLRQRRGDVPLLVEHFVRVGGAKLGREVRGVAAEAMAELEGYAWPGNVRELRNVIERALVMLTGDVLRLPAPLVPDGLVADERPAEEVGTAPLSELLRRYRRGLLDEALHRAGGRQQQAARLLGLHRQSLARMLRDGDPEGGGAG